MPACSCPQDVPAGAQLGVAALQQVRASADLRVSRPRVISFQRRSLDGVGHSDGWCLRLSNDSMRGSLAIDTHVSWGWCHRVYENVDIL